ncbi:hypothetical protein [Flagellimonas iocasae]|uniref:Lipocalin-like domain-containing protein n=1 Tax=Flagellimonas iocasae TaxID=2055905 RepID=A0ABW4XUY1_9FLAO
MKVWPIYLFFALLLVFSSWSLIDKDSPEVLILGDWEEVSWKFEKLDHNNELDFSINDLQKQEICKNLIIHKAETWQFSPNKRLTFLEDGKVREDLKWSIKGRGHILELKHNNAVVEDYQVVGISDNELVVQFNFDLQVKGIVKMTFKRIPKKEYAQKI